MTVYNKIAMGGGHKCKHMPQLHTRYICYNFQDLIQYLQYDTVCSSLEYIKVVIYNN